MTEDTEKHPAEDPAPGDRDLDEERVLFPKGGGFIWQVVPLLMLVAMAVLAISMWRRVQQVDPVRRCADAYESSYTALDTTLVDRIKVRSPDGGPRTNCGVLRASGEVAKMPRRDMPMKRMP